MSEHSDKLREMINNADDQIVGIDDSTSQIITQIEEYENQRDAIQYELMDQISFIDLSSYLVITKVPEKGGPGGYITFGGDYGITNVINWIVFDGTNVPVYEYNSVGWDGDSTIVNFIDQWNFGYDYIHRTFGLTGTYGLQAKIDQLYNALTLLQINREKISDSKTVFENYAS
jgi:hypothetical protein